MSVLPSHGGGDSPVRTRLHMISLFNRENTGKFSKFEENLIIVYAKRQGSLIDGIVSLNSEQGI